MISALSSILGIEGEEKMSDEEVDKLIDQVVDPVGTFYKYGLPAAIINRKVIR
jgi:F420-non-reducing hydrogenase small subunit